MDENNLDSLLDELSSMDEELNDNIDADSGVDVDAGDMNDISLDELDDLESMDLGDLDFDDIDFDDVDITNLDVDSNPVVKKREPEKDDDMNLDSLIENASKERTQAQDETRMQDMSKDDDVFGEADMQMQEDTSLDSGVFDDAMFDQMTLGANQTDKKTNPYTSGEESLDALLQSSMAESLMNGDLADIEDISEKKPKKAKKKSKGEKKTISEIIFGEPDEDDIAEEAYLEEK